MRGTKRHAYALNALEASKKRIACHHFLPEIFQTGSGRQKNASHQVFVRITALDWRAAIASAHNTG
jgi:hypothetical protein